MSINIVWSYSPFVAIGLQHYFLLLRWPDKYYFAIVIWNKNIVHNIMEIQKYKSRSHLDYIESSGQGQDLWNSNEVLV